MPRRSPPPAGRGSCTRTRSSGSGAPRRRPRGGPPRHPARTAGGRPRGSPPWRANLSLPRRQRTGDVPDVVLDVVEVVPADRVDGEGGAVAAEAGALPALP